MQNIIETKKAEILHNLFIFSIFTKGINGLFELIGGIIMLSANSVSISKIIQIIFQYEIIPGPNNLMANHLIHFSQGLSTSTISFMAIYLIIYGSINIGLFFGLWTKKLWAYPLAGFFMSLFISYQFIRFFYTHSSFLLFFILIDLAIIALLRIEYHRLKFIVI